MKYMLMMNTPERGAYGINDWPQEAFKAHIAFMIDFIGKLGASGELVSAEGLAGPDQAKLVRAGPDGKPVTDGVFPESKEFLAGFWIIDCASEKRAIEIAGQASAAPGIGGAQMSIPIELRQVMSAPPMDV